MHVTFSFAFSCRWAYAKTQTSEVVRQHTEGMVGSEFCWKFTSLFSVTEF